MLDPFGIALGCLGIKTKTEQEPQHDLVPLLSG